MALATLNPVQDSVKTDVPNAFSLSTTEEKNLKHTSI